MKGRPVKDGNSLQTTVGKGVTEPSTKGRPVKDGNPRCISPPAHTISLDEGPSGEGRQYGREQLLGWLDSPSMKGRPVKDGNAVAVQAAGIEDDPSPR